MFQADQPIVAQFNPIIKTYILFYVGLILIITVIGIPLALIWFLGVGQWYSKHYFEKLSCELTDKNLRFRKGILFQVEKTIPLENIQDMTFVEGPLLRAFNLTIIKVETAGQTLNHGNAMSLIGIYNSDLFRDQVLERRLKIVNRRHGNTQEESLENISKTLSSIENILLRQTQK
jgi:putative membrane protein